MVSTRRERYATTLVLCQTFLSFQTKDVSNQSFYEINSLRLNFVFIESFQIHKIIYSILTLLLVHLTTLKVNYFSLHCYKLTSTNITSIELICTYT